MWSNVLAAPRREAHAGRAPLGLTLPDASAKHGRGRVGDDVPSCEWMTSRRLLRLAALLVASVPLSSALAASRFSTLATGAQRLESLGPFLERYIGSCRDAFTRDECERNVRAARRGLDGRVFAATLGERTTEMVKAERTRSGWRFVVTPFIDGGGLALTNGAPQGDALGRPRIGYLILEGALPDGMDEMALESALRRGGSSSRSSSGRRGPGR